MWSWRIDIIECMSFGYGASGGLSFMYISLYIAALVFWVKRACSACNDGYDGYRMWP